jgi:CO dehydrogenase maturation factor
MQFMAVGGFDETLLGTTCFHTFTEAMSIYLNYLLDSQAEYFVGDMTAGADPFSTHLVTQFDAIFLVVEPTLHSVGVYSQCVEFAEQFDVEVRVVGNKIEDEQDVDFIRSKVGDALVGWMGKSGFVRRSAREERPAITDLEPHNLATLATLRSLVDNVVPDPERRRRHTIEFHRRAAEAWASAVYGCDLMKQIDDGFFYSEKMEVA